MKIQANLNIDGILLIDKPNLLTSNAVLQRVKKILQASKAGHMGCLDPLATGMLPICLGEATKFAQLGLDADKCYTVGACFGKTTTTGDVQGDLLKVIEDRVVSSDEILDKLPSFLGEIWQVPPMYSALKYQGKKLYELARAGKEVPRSPRLISIRQFDMTHCTYPYAEFTVHCSKGTYIRTLIEDLGAALGVGGHVTQLRRLYTAGFEHQSMYRLDEYLGLSKEERLQALLPIDILLTHLPMMQVSESDLHKLYQGQPLSLICNKAEGTQRLYNDAGQFQGIGAWDPKIGLLKAQRLRSTERC